MIVKDSNNYDILRIDNYSLLGSWPMIMIIIIVIGIIKAIFFFCFNFLFLSLFLQSSGRLNTFLRPGFGVTAEGKFYRIIMLRKKRKKKRKNKKKRYAFAHCFA